MTPPTSMRHHHQIARLPKVPGRSIDAAHTAAACTIREARHGGALSQQSGKRAGPASALAPRGRNGTCLNAVESSIVNRPPPVDWLRTAAQQYATWFRQARLTVPRWDPAKRRPNLPWNNLRGGGSSCCKPVKSRSVSPIWSKPLRKPRKSVTPRGGRAIPTAAVHEPGDGVIGCEASVTNLLADRSIKITLLIFVATFLD